MKDTREPVERGIVRVTSCRTGRVSYECKWSWQDASGRRQYGYQRRRTLREARAERAKRTTEVREGTYQAPSKETVGQYAERWLDRMQAIKWTTSTAYGRRKQWANYLQPALANLKLTAVTRAHCQRVLDEMTAAGRAAGTVGNVHGLMSGLFHAAEVEGLIARNPAAHLTLPTVRREPPRTWTAEQVRRFLAVTAGDDDHALYTLLLTTGMRIGEARALRWEHVDLQRGLIRVADTMRRTLTGAAQPQAGTKTTRARELPLTPGCVVALRTHQDTQAETRRMAKVWDVRGFVFADEFGRPFREKPMRDRLDAAITRAALPRITPHQMRHTVATLLLEAGVSDRAIQEMLGHASLRTTMGIYAHVTDVLRGQARDAMSAVLRPPGPANKSVKE